MNTIFNYIHDFFYPPYCPSCGRAVTIGTFWCARCFTDVYDPREVQLENNLHYALLCFRRLYKRA